MKFTKSNNPNRRRRRRRFSRADADILVGKMMIMDKRTGHSAPLETYEHIAEVLRR